MQHSFWLFIVIGGFLLLIWNDIISEMISDKNAIIRFLGYFLAIIIAVIVLLIVLYQFFDIHLLKMVL